MIKYNLDKYSELKENIEDPLTQCLKGCWEGALKAFWRPLRPAG